MIVVVGRGPSLQGRQLGSWIDGFDTVVRLSVPGASKYGYRPVASEDFGSRSDYVLTTTSHQFRHLKNTNFNGVRAVWLYRTRYLKQAIGNPGFFEKELRESYGYSGPVVFIRDIIKPWVQWYKDNLDQSRLDTTKTLHPSKGTAAILTAMCLNQGDIVAVGFDDVLLGTSHERKMHDWQTENLLLKRASRELGVRLLALQ